MLKKIKNTLVIASLSVLLFYPILSFAQGGSGQPNPGGSGQPSAPQIIKIDNPFDCGGDEDCTIVDLLGILIDRILIPIGSVIAVLMVMWAGFLYVTARGNTAQIARAHQALLWAVIGAAILLGAKVISQAIQTTVNQLEG